MPLAKKIQEFVHDTAQVTCADYHTVESYFLLTVHKKTGPGCGGIIHPYKSLFWLAIRTLLSSGMRLRTQAAGRSQECDLGRYLYVMLLTIILISV